jgi:hypothetical protein
MKRNFLLASYLTNEEIYNILFNEFSSETLVKEAKEEIAHMSDEDWNDWIIYKDLRKKHEY